MEQPIDLSQLRQFAQSPAAQQLIAMLQQSGGAALQDAVVKAASGDYSQAKDTITKLLDTPEGKQLLRQLEGKP